MRLLHESSLTVRLAAPLMIGQLSQMLLGVADTVMVGHLGVTELAALTFANALFHVPFVFGIGVLTSVSVITSNSRGADDPASARESCRHGVYLATLLGMVLFAVSWLVSMRLGLFGQPSDVSARTTVYFRILMASMIPALISIALKNHVDALNRPWPPFWIFLGGVLLNIGLNWVMIYGNLGCPALGFEGAAWATFIARTAILATLLLWLKRTPGLRIWIPDNWWLKPAWFQFKRLLAIGTPASLQMLCEVSAFSLAGLLMGHFGQQALAAHQIAITLAATAFMVPLGLSMALTVRIGEVFGSNQPARMRPIMISGWMLAFAYASVAATLFLLFGHSIAALFTNDQTVIQMATSLLVIVGVFQIFDGIQVTSSAMLRGMHDARLPALIGLVSYWFVGLPVGAILAFHLNHGASGIWWGLAVGLFAACITMGPRLWRRTRLEP